MKVSYNNARIGDVPAIMRVMEDAFDPAFGEAWTAGQMLTLFAVPSSRLAIARAGDAIVGFAAARIVAPESELLLLGVTPSARGQGIGCSLVKDWQLWAASRGATEFFLEMRSDNPALKLYQSCGFSESGRRPDYYRGGDGKLRDALTMRNFSS